MKILALEFSSPQRSVAVVQSGGGSALLAVSQVVETGPGSTHALEIIDTALRQARIEREQIECLAIGLGPGSYTGIRAAIAMAQGWQLARDIKLLGVSSADVIAAQAQAEGVTRRVAVIIDAQRNEFYLAEYELDPGGWRPLKPLRLASSAEIQELKENEAPPQLTKLKSLIIGPEVTRWFPQGRLIIPHASTVGRLALTRSDFVPGEALEPIYLRETKFVKAPPPRIID